MTDNTQSSNAENRPTHRLVQEKAYYRFDRNGNRQREIQQIELCRGWLQKAKDSDIHYISWENSTIPVLPDADGAIVRRTWEINYDD